MLEIFISHAAADRTEADQLLSWLRESGRQDVFVDLDPEKGLKAGEQWQTRLLDAISECEAILCLLSEEWIASKWCWAEYVLAKKLGKRCIPLIVKQLDWTIIPSEILAEHQVIDLVSDEECWIKLEAGLRVAGIAATSFPLEKGRRPYPGLTPLIENDAALFFGRDPEILAALDELRRISEVPSRDLFAIVGPSGAGKSSFLRAGLLPRLLRDNRNFLPLPALRSSGSILGGPAGFWSSLQDALARPEIAERLSAATPRSRGAIQAMVEHDHDALSAIIEAFLGVAGQQAGLAKDMHQTLVLAIDQSEELLEREHHTETKHFLELLHRGLMGRVNVITAVTIRTDAYGLLQSDPLFAGFRHRPFNLSPMPVHRFPSVIEGPAAQVGLTLEPALTDALVKDASGADALPIVAFTLERLYRDFGADGALTLDNYRTTKGIAGAIEAAFQAVFTAAPTRGLPADREQLDGLVRQLFIPHLVRVDETGAFARRIANMDDLPPRTRAVAELLVENRLLVTSKDSLSDGTYVEIAHEALIRSWEQLASWLTEERAFLVWREEIRRARLSWNEGRRDLLTGCELAIASDWKAARASDIAEPDLELITASEARMAAIAARAKRIRWLVSSVGVAVIAVVTTLWIVADRARDEAVLQQATAEQQARAARAREVSLRARAIFESNAGETGLAGLLAGESLRLSHTVEAQQLAAEILALSPRGMRKLNTLDPWSKLRLSPDGRVILSWTHDSNGIDWAPASGSVVSLDPATFSTLSDHQFDGRMSPALSPGGAWLAVSGHGRRLEVIDLATNEVVRSATYKTLMTAQFDPAGRRLYVADTRGVIEWREWPDWHIVKRLEFPVKAPEPRRLGLGIHPSGKALLVSTNRGAYIVPTDGGPHRALTTVERGVAGATYDATGEHILTLEYGLVARLWDARSGHEKAEFRHENTASAAAFSDDGLRVATATRAGDVKIWSTATGALEHNPRHEKRVNTVAFSPDGTILAAGDDAGVVCLWDAKTGERIHQWTENDEIWRLVFADDGRALIAGAGDGQVRRYDVATKKQTERTRLSGGVHTLVVDPVSGAMAMGVKGTDHSRSWADMHAIDRRTGKELWSMAHNGDFSSLVFRPDGSTFATTTGKSGDLKIWDTATGSLKSESNAKGYPNSLEFSSDGTRLVARSHAASVLDSRDARVLATIGEPGGVTQMGIADDRRTVVTFGQDNAFRAWDALTGEEHWRRVIDERDRFIMLSGDGSRFAYTSDDGRSLYVKDARTGNEISVIPRREHTVVKLSRDGRRTLLLNRNNTLQDPDIGARYSHVELWDLDSGEILAEVRRDKAPFTTAEFKAGYHVLVWSAGAGMEMLDAQTGESLWRKDGKPSYPIAVPKLAKSSHHLFLPNSGGTVVIHPGTGERLRTLDFPIGTHTQNRDGNVVAGIMVREPGDDEPKIALADINTGEWLKSADVSPDNLGIKDIQISEDDTRLLIHFKPSDESAVVVKILDVSTLAEVGGIESDSSVQRVELLADANMLLTQDSSNTVRVWQVSTGKELRRFAHGHTADGVDVAARVNQAVTWTKASLRVWNLETAQELAHKVTLGPVDTAALHPNGSWVAYITKRSRESDAGRTFDAILLWPIGSNAPPILLPIEEASSEIAFDPTGRRLAAQIGKRTVRVWDLETLRPLLTTTALLQSEASGFSFSDDGETLFVKETAPGYKSGIRTWDIANKTEVARIDMQRDWREAPGSSRLFVHQETGWRELDLDSGDLEQKPWPELYARVRPILGGESVAGSNGETIKVINLASGEATKVRRDEDAKDITTFAFNATGDRIAFAQREFDSWYRPGDVVLRDLKTGASIARARPDATISKLVFADEGRSVVMLGTPGGEHTIDAGTHLLLWRWENDEVRTISTDNPIHAVATSVDGSLLATGEGEWEHDGERSIIVGDPRVRIWDARTGQVVHALPRERPVSDVEFSPDGRLLVARDAFAFTVYRVDDWGESRQFRLDFGQEGGASAFAGNDWVVAPAKNGLYLFSVRSEQSHFLRHESRGSPSFKISADGRTIATATRKTLYVWDVETGQPWLQKVIGLTFNYAIIGPDVSG